MENETRYEPIRENLRKDEKKVKVIFIIEWFVIILILANVIYLNINFFQQLKSAQSTSISTAESTPTPKAPSVSEIASPSVSAQPTTKSSVPFSKESPVKDYFIPLGSGTSQASDWTDVTGAQATVDLGQYQNIKAVVFEASVTVPTGNQAVLVRLFNITDKHPVWYSEVTMDGGSSAYLTSNPIVYDKGSKIYQVQMKTQLGFTANLTQARIHIALK